MSQSSIARSSVVMAAGTLTSRVLGLVRNALLIAALGATASGAADAFNVANMLPTQLYNLIIGGVLNAILVPQIVRAMRQRNGEELVNRILTAAGLLIAAVSAVLTVAAPVVIMLYASGLGRWQPLAFAFAFWCMPQVFFYGLYALWGQVLNARHSFGPYMWSPVLNNIISIASILAYLHLYGGYSAGQDPGIWDASRVILIGGCSTLGIAVQALVLYVPLRRCGFRPRLVFGVRGLGLGSMSKVALWALLGTAIVSLGDLAVTNLGSRAVTAAESARYADVIVPSTTMYANALLVYMLPQSLITTSIITALFTRMSEKAAAGDAKGVRDDLSLGLRSIAVFTVLFAAGIMTLAGPALQLFVPSISREVADASAPILSVLAVGIIFQGAWFTTQRVMLAYADTKRLLAADCVVGSIAVLSCLLAFLLAPATHWMVLAAAGNTISLAAACVAIIPLLRRHLPDLDGRRILSTYARLIASAALAVVVGVLTRGLIGPADGSMTGTRALDALVIILVTAVVMTLVYLAVARVLRVSELGVLFRPASKVLLALGARLPGGLGRAVRRGGRALALPAAEPADHAPAPVPAASGVPMPGAAADRIGMYASLRTGGDTMGDGTPIGSGRYQLVSPLPATLPRVLRHRGQDTILDRPVTVLSLTDITPCRREVLEAATRAVLVEDQRMQRVYDVEQGNPAFIVTEPAAGQPLSVLAAAGLTPAQARAVVGEVAQVLDACSRRDLHHLNLSPDSVRIRPNGSVQVCGVGIEAAVLGLEADRNDPLAADRADAHALVELLYFSLTGRWPGKRTGIPSAPLSGGTPVAPSTLASGMSDSDADLDALVAQTWGAAPPTSAAEVAALLSPWDTSVLPVQEPASEATPPSSATGALGSGLVDAAQGLLGRLGALASSRRSSRAAGSGDQDPAPAQPVAAQAPAPSALTPDPAQASGPSSLTPSAPTLDPALDADEVLEPPASALPRPSTPSAPEPEPAPAPAPEPESPESPAVSEEEQEASRAVSRTTAIVLVAALVTVLVGAFFAVTNLLSLASLKISDEDVPAAKTVPTVAATTPDEAQEDGQVQSQAEEAAPITVSGAQSLDPHGDDNEHPELASALVDGDPATSWYSRYYASSSLAWKQGLGVGVTLAQEAEVSAIDMQGTGSGGHVEIRSTSPEDPQGGTLLAEGAFTEGTTTFEIPATTTSSIVVWVTELPTASDGLLKVTIGEITLR
ncbi:murein biosynthesis integral membrane protein MurJ [Actinomyces faecalis]|uniref:murein biosynthesis integral membrane protein MurJ n=1 Tax=Actinomyces faecalis TaxID=2722820 RepID=UPI0015555DAA|nr:murein biosynthesis integral membrane protein MurJ [Actinomyces faecalis]